MPLKRWHKWEAIEIASWEMFFFYVAKTIVVVALLFYILAMSFQLSSLFITTNVPSVKIAQWKRVRETRITAAVAWKKYKKLNYCRASLPAIVKKLTSRKNISSSSGLCCSNNSKHLAWMCHVTNFFLIRALQGRHTSYLYLFSFILWANARALNNNRE